MIRYFAGWILLITMLLGVFCAPVNEKQKAFNKQDYEQTRVLCLAGIAQDSTDVDSWALLAKIYTTLDSAERARYAWEQVLRLEPDETSHKASAEQSYVQLGDAALQREKLKTARDLFMEVVKLNSENVDALSRLADLDETSGDWESARKRYDQLIELSQDPTPFVTKVNNLDGKIRVLNETFAEAKTLYYDKQYEDAERQFARCVEANPGMTEAEYFMNLCRAKILMQKPTKKSRKAARTVLEKAMVLDKTAAEPHYLTAKLWEMENKNDLLANAIREYKISYDLDQDGPLAAESLKKYRALKTKKEKMDKFWSKGRKKK